MARADSFGTFPGEISPMSIGEKSAEVIGAKKSRNGDGAKDRRSFNTFNENSDHERVET
jgi:hypothetical protein